MNRTLALLGSPELYWLAVWAVSHFLARWAERAGAPGIVVLERMCWIVPLLAIPASFALFYWLVPLTTSRGWLTARLLVATLVGLNACLFTILDAIDYGDSRNSGVLGFWVYGMMLGGLAWIVGYGVVLLTGARGRAI